MLDGSQWSPYQVKAAADAYYKLSCVLSDSLSDDPGAIENEGHTLAIIGASATNRFLALELYFKAIFIGLGIGFPKTHDFVALFDRLPQDDQKRIQHRYDALAAIGNTTDMNWALNVSFQKGDVELDRPIVGVLEESLAGLLARNRKGFENWRYVFQEAKASGPTIYTYEHRALGVLCIVLQEVLDEGLRCD